MALVAQTDLDRFIGVPEAAERLNVHVDTARQMIRVGAFPVPVRRVAGKQVVSLRRLVEHLYADESLEAAS